MGSVEDAEAIEVGCSCFTWTLFCSSASAFPVSSVLNPVKDALPLDNILPFKDPLKLLLNVLGISVEYLLEGLRKSVNGLTPEASEAVKKLLVTTACGADLSKGFITLSTRPAHPHSHLTLLLTVNVCFSLSDCAHINFASLQERQGNRIPRFF